MSMAIDGGKVSGDLHITVPSDLSAPSNGRFLGKVDHGDGWTTWNWTTRDANTYAIALAVAPYVELTDSYVSALTFYVWTVLILGGAGTVLGPIVGSIVFWWGGWPFLVGGVSEVRDRQPGMMLLITMAIMAILSGALACGLGIAALYP